MDQAAVSVEPDQRSSTTADRSGAVEAVHVRNYDHREGHSVRVTVSRDGGVLVAERHYLAPGQSVRIVGRLDPGEYELRVAVDGVERRRAIGRLDDTPGGTAVVEIGNGVVSLTQGADPVSAAG